MSTVELAGSVSMNVIVPVGLDPPERGALSLSVAPGSERVTLGLAVVVRVGLAWGVSVSMSVAVLLPGSGSVPPAGGNTEAVLVSEPVADGLIWATAVKMAKPPGSRVTGVTMLPKPLGTATLDPAEATAVQLAAVMAAGNRSITVASTAVLGPLLVTTML